LATRFSAGECSQAAPPAAATRRHAARCTGDRAGLSERASAGGRPGAVEGIAVATLLECRACPRLAEFLDGVRRDYPTYHARPVLPFGDSRARLLIVGLAPGFHGANRTGRPFTGDYAGVLLYDTLHRYGFGSHGESIAADDGLRLTD